MLGVLQDCSSGTQELARLLWPSAIQGGKSVLTAMIRVRSCEFHSFSHKYIEISIQNRKVKIQNEQLTIHFISISHSITLCACRTWHRLEIYNDAKMQREDDCHECNRMQWRNADTESIEPVLNKASAAAMYF